METVEGLGGTKSGCHSSFMTSSLPGKGGSSLLGLWKGCW